MLLQKQTTYICAYLTSVCFLNNTYSTYIIWILCFKPRGVSKLLPHLILSFTPCTKMNAQKCWGGQPPKYGNSRVSMEMGILRGKLSCSFNTKVHSHDGERKWAFLMCPFPFFFWWRRRKRICCQVHRSTWEHHQQVKLYFGPHQIMPAKPESQYFISHVQQAHADILLPLYRLKVLPLLPFTSVQIRHNTSHNLPALISSLMCLCIPHADSRCNLSFWKEKADSSLLSSAPSVSDRKWKVWVLQTRGSALTWLN